MPLTRFGIVPTEINGKIPGKLLTAGTMFSINSHSHSPIFKHKRTRHCQVLRRIVNNAEVRGATLTQKQRG